MTTITLSDVERIDIMEGPNFEGLVQPWLLLSGLGEMSAAERVDEIRVPFGKVAYFLANGSRLSKEMMGETSHMTLLGIEPLSRHIKSIRSGDVVITVLVLGMAFRGHYNTHSRKGSLTRLRDALCEE